MCQLLHFAHSAAPGNLLNLPEAHIVKIAQLQLSLPQEVLPVDVLKEHFPTLPLVWIVQLAALLLPVVLQIVLIVPLVDSQTLSRTLIVVIVRKVSTWMVLQLQVAAFAQSLLRLPWDPRVLLIVFVAKGIIEKAMFSNASSAQVSRTYLQRPVGQRFVRILLETWPYGYIPVHSTGSVS
jgi:hypothetical protein